jgi:GH25 family lysozyme M1 (1,4-beta-N-acetylmuramidase)
LSIVTSLVLAEAGLQGQRRFGLRRLVGWQYNDHGIRHGLAVFVDHRD